MTPQEARRRFASATVARLATAGADCRPHLVPIVFAVNGETIYSVVDAKPKRSAALRRLRNVASNPLVSVLVDHYDDTDWDALWWVRADGSARVLSLDEPEAARAVESLAQRYPQQRPRGPVLAVDVQRWSGWAARERSL
ncbi:MAG: pyridoxamine 5-phosphate oxidase-related,FMN-binding protein [Solirubrobacterales bacterium]|nr:pyridoxamine 5-phosphate oxidase-related,FMN-binding protein [Solirubrobacterales bacterium]